RRAGGGAADRPAGDARHRGGAPALQSRGRPLAGPHCDRSRRGRRTRRGRSRLRRAPAAGLGGDRVKKWLPPVRLLLGLVALWELVVRAADVPDYLFPAPSAVAAALRDDAGTLGDATLVTAREMLLGYLLAVAVGSASRWRCTSRPCCAAHSCRCS